MHRVIITGIVLTCCVLATSDVYDISGYGDSISYNQNTIPQNITEPTESCDHDKLKAVAKSMWTVEMRMENCLTTFHQRLYLCKKCKATIVIQQAIELPKAKECEKTHFDVEWGNYGGIITIPMVTDTFVGELN